ncbi:hypothetical protein ONR49_26255, partial [Salmonella enterica subsp. enterica serovar Virginia]|nr:hypothetical protein [Salmonella enterica subsp. enterica serovar Virginia]
QLFKENKCATCHGGIILGGRSFEPLGLKRDFNFGEITAADIGYPRHAPTGTPVLVDGIRTRTVGTVSMDMLAVDLMPCPQAGI